ncbi:MAG: thioesterase superfamily protein [Osedax symbiont Rs2]|nr:MAG: thioesterase superfamily protein [Osedax symbiont Rs2]
MFSNTLSPRFLETDALGHINNTVFPMWFEASRDPLFKIFSPQMDINNWPLILAGFNLSFHAETHYGADVQIKTFISRIGNSSFDIYQQCWQQGIKTASGTSTMVHFCHQKKRSVVLTAALIEELQGHLMPPQ